MQVLSDPPSSVGSAAGPRPPVRPPKTRPLNREYAGDDEFPRDVPVGYDWFLQPASRRGFRRRVAAVAGSVTSLLLGFLLWRTHNLSLLVAALGIVLAILAIAAVWTLGSSIRPEAPSEPTVRDLHRPPFHLKS
jgi:hypothetical protein